MSIQRTLGSSKPNLLKQNIKMLQETFQEIHLKVSLKMKILNQAKI